MKPRANERPPDAPRAPWPICLLYCLASSAPALEIVVEGGVEDPLPIAVIPFLAPVTPAGPSGESQVQPEPADVISDDLRYSGSFEPIPTIDMPGLPRFFEEIQFADWRRLGIENVVLGRTIRLEGDRMQIEFRLIDIYRQTQIVGRRIPFLPGQDRRVAHSISDLVYQELTGARGVFSTRIAYIGVTETDPGERHYTLEIADYDGYNPQILLESKWPLLSPAWAPDGRRIAFVALEERASAIYIQDVTTGERRKVSATPGLNSAPRFSPDGGRLAISLSKDGNPEIYVLHLGSKLLQRLTEHPAIDTEPDWSPDGNRLVFTSDRSGNPQLYEIELSGGRTERLVFEGKFNARAHHSPDGRRLALIHGGEDGGFRIAVFDRDTERLRLLTEDRLAESPYFAPNGRMIVFASESGLATISAAGGARRRLPGDKRDRRDPAWAPYARR